MTTSQLQTMHLRIDYGSENDRIPANNLPLPFGFAKENKKRLTPETVMQIKSRLKELEHLPITNRCKKVGVEFDMHHSTIIQIETGKIHNDIKPAKQPATISQ